MSGFIPDLANWALRGGAGNVNNDNSNGDNNDDSDNNNNNNNAAPPAPAATESEMRARRLQTLERMQRQQQQLQREQEQASAKEDDPQPMDVEKTPSPSNAGAKTAAASTPMEMETSVQAPLFKKAKETHSSPTKTNAGGSSSSTPKKKAAPSPSTTSDPARKLQRKKELLIKKVLNITLGKNKSDSACIPIDIGDDDGNDSTNSNNTIGVHTIAEILATRLALPKDALSSSSPPQKPLIQYLAAAHRKAADEAKTMKQTSSSASATATNDKNAPLLEILQEIQNQVVSYASSSLMIPDLFEQAADSQEQLAEAFTSQATSNTSSSSSASDATTSIIFGVNGLASSFYHQLCDELYTQDPDAFQRVIAYVATNIMKPLKSCDHIDSLAMVAVSNPSFLPSGMGTTAAQTSPLGLVLSLQAVCSHKKAALVVTQLPDFLLPPAGSAAANETIRPPMPAGADLIRMIAGGDHRPYKKRSGVALEKNTLMGLMLRISTPKNNPAFSPTNILRQSVSSVEQTSNQQRQQLRIYQTATIQVVLNLIKGGPQARQNVMQWIADCLLVNPGATAIRPDTSKVSSSAMLLNTNVLLLKLCEPFVNDEKKRHLIDPGFISSAKDNHGVFPTRGDDAIARLGEMNNDDGSDTAMATYEPKNAFIPQCFFFTARNLALSIVPMLSQHENLLRHISHQHWELSNQNRDIQSDPHFCILVAKQRANEVALFQEEMVVDTLRFCNLMAKVLYEMDDESLRFMPEHFVDNVCDILMSIAKLKPKLLRGMEFRYVFSMVVKLLSPTYASMVRNYNLRAMLGDVLYELYLPPDSGNDKHRRDVPSSISQDPMKGGQSYLLSDTLAQETLAPSLLLLYGEVEHTGYYDKMSHRAKISSLIKYLWESKEHRPAFQKITQDQESFIKFANGIINETNTLIATVMQKLPEIRAAQEQMANTAEWGRLSEEEQSIVTSRLDDNEREVRHALPLCNKTMQMFGYLNTDQDIRTLFLLPELYPRLVNMLNHVLQKIVGGKGLDLKVKDPEQYEFRPKEMLRDLCAIFALFASSKEFQMECARIQCKPEDLRQAVKKCQQYNLLTGESMKAFETLPDLVEAASHTFAEDEALIADAPDEFLDEILSTFMVDPVILPSGHFVDRSTIRQHLLNDPIDPFNRESMTIDDVKPAVELKAKIDQWLEAKRAAARK